MSGPFFFPKMSYTQGILLEMEKQKNYSIPQRVTLTPNPTHGTLPVENLVLQFTGANSVFDIPTLPSITAEAATALSDVLGHVSDTQNLHTVLCRRDANHPHRLGLVAKKLPVGHVGLLPVSAADAANGRNHHGWNRSPLESDKLNLDRIPDELHDDLHGWFAPTADPTVFGTIYLIPTGYLTESYRSRDSLQEFGWVVAQVGIDGYLSFAEWNNESKVLDLVHMVTNADTESVTTMRALSDSEGVAKGLKRHQYRSALRDAREAFANLTLRPRLVPQIVADAMSSQSLLEFTSYQHSEDTVFGLVTLDDYSVYGWRDKPKPVAAAYSLLLKDPATETTFNALATALKTALAARKLGTVVILPGDFTRLWITRDVALLSRFGNVFGATAGAPFTPFVTGEEPRTGLSA